MERERRERLNQIMAGIAGGDDAALFHLWEEFGGDIRAAMAAHARLRGHHRLTPDALYDLAGEAWLALRPLARSWRPDGAVPWVWARARLAAIVDEVLGPVVGRVLPARDGEHIAEPDVLAYLGADPPPGETLGGLAESDERCRLLRRAIDAALSPVDQELFLGYELQRQSGDPSPAVTMGALFGLKPATVRQRVWRARRKLAAVVDTDLRYAALAGLALLRATRARRAA